MVPGTAGNRSKYILRQFPIIRFYGALAVSLVFFLIQLVVAHVAHSLILQIDCYHMLYNILSLITCIITAKASKEGTSVKNTFGWRRIDVCGAVANLCFLSALGFSVVVECLQTIAHASHHENMHYPEAVGAVGILGFVVNLTVFFLVGGYTLHQSGFLCSTKDGRGEDSVISTAMRRGPYSHVMRERQGLFGIFRDMFGCVLVVVCAVIVYIWGNENSADESSSEYVDYVDPCLTISTVLVLGLTSYNFAKEAGYILLLTIPDHINVTSLQEELKRHFPDVFDIHELHVWQLTPARIIASVHVVLQKPQGYLNIQNNIIHFLHEKGISHVTMQPEFLQMTEGEESESPQSLRRRKCFLPCCSDDECHEMQCCHDDEDEHDHDHDHDHDHSHSHSHSVSGHSHAHHSGGTAGGSLSQCGSSINNSSLNVQSPGRVGGVLKSESLNNHIDLVDISLDNVNISKESGSFTGSQRVIHENLGGGGGEEESDDFSDDEEGLKAELRPMI